MVWLLWAWVNLGQRPQGDEEARLPPMPIPNAFQSYENAIPAIIGGQSVYTHQPLYMSGEATPKPKPEVAKAVERSGDAFVWISNGLNQKYAQPFTALAPYPEPFAKNHQLLGKLLMARGDVRAEQGDVDGAFSDYMDLLRFGYQLVNEGEGTTPVVGMNLMEHARGCLWRLSPRMTYAQLADAAGLLKQFSVSQRPYSALLGREERMLLFRLADMGKRSNFILIAYERLGIDPFHSPADLPPESLHSLTRSQLREDCVAFFDGWLERTSKGIAHRGKPPTYEEVTSKRDPFLGYMARHGFMPPACNDFTWYVFLRNQAANGLAALAFATRAYQKREGSMPKAFSDFGPSLLASIPPDPFADGAKLGCAFGDERAVFKSVGSGLDPSAPAHSAVPGPHPDPRAEFENDGPLEWAVVP